MLVVNKETNEILDKMPLILMLNSAGTPLSWCNFEDAAFYKAKEKILWSLGNFTINLRGGVNAKTGLQSTMSFDTIIAIKSDRNPSHYRKLAPTLTNSSLFARDKFICCYCATTLKHGTATREHLIPTSRGGKDVWTNVCTSCKSCNLWKGDKTLEEADMKLLYVPYQPVPNEAIILQNRKILACQMEYLMKGVPEHSRLHEIN